MTVYLIEHMSGLALCSAVCSTEELARLYCEKHGLDYGQSVTEYTVILDEEDIY